MITYNMTRSEVELNGRSGRNTFEETESPRLVHVMDEFDLFVLKDDTSLTPCLTHDGFWEAWITSWITRWLRPGMTFLDIGANVGYYTMIADRLVGKYGSVVAYEANPVYAELLRNTRNRNNANFKLRNYAVADHLGEETLIVPDTLHGSASIVQKFEDFSNKTEYVVPATTLDHEVMNLIFFRHDIVKIDAEGAEEMIWAGGSRLWDSLDHTTVMLEWTPNAYSDQFMNKLYDWGYVSTVGYDGGEYSVTKEWINSQSDWVMLIIRKR